MGEKENELNFENMWEGIINKHMTRSSIVRKKEETYNTALSDLFINNYESTLQ